MRKKMFGYYRGEKYYVLENEDGDIVHELQKGSELYIEEKCRYYCGEREDGKLFLAYEGVAEDSKGIEVLEDSTWYLMADSVLTARHGGLLKEFKPIKRYDRLLEIVKYLNFIPQCVKIGYELSDLEVNSDFVENCPNYTSEKEWYRYEIYTDSTDFADIKVGNQVCPTCARYKECKKRQKRTYRQYYNGTYSIMVKINVRNGRKKLQALEITRKCDRESLADMLMEIFGISNEQLKASKVFEYKKEEVE